MFTKTAAMLCESLPCALSGSSLSSDIATQVTRIVFEQCPSKFPSFGCCHLFPPFWRSCFSFYLHHTFSGVHRVWSKQWLSRSSQRWMKQRRLIVLGEAGALLERTSLLLVEVKLETSRGQTPKARACRQGYAYAI